MKFSGQMVIGKHKVAMRVARPDANSGCSRRPGTDTVRYGMLFEPSQIAPLLHQLADQDGIYLGTSSWKFPGWCGILYDEDDFLWGKHFSKARFKRECLTRYSEVFRSVCFEASYYHLPRKGEFEKLVAQVPDGFRFSFKVPDQITIKNYPKARTFGDRSGKPNDYFLDPRLFRMGFLRPLEKIRDYVGMLVFEFSHFHSDDFAHGRDFVAALDHFFAELPEGWNYAVEVRNANLLHAEHFAVLQRHKVAHVYNQWTLMPGVDEQINLHPVGDNPFIAARYLLTPQRSRDWAMREFEPFNQLKEVDPVARETLQFLLARARAEGGPKPAFIYIGNLLEGNALHTISDVIGKIS